RVDGVLQLQDLPLDRHGDLLGEVAVGHRRRHFGDVADLAGEVAGHAVDAVGEALPDTALPADLGLPAQASFCAHLSGDAGYLAGVAAELVDYRVDGVLQLQDLAADVDGDLLGEVAVGHRGGHLGDVPHLRGEVAGHAVD